MGRRFSGLWPLLAVAVTTGSFAQAPGRKAPALPKPFQSQATSSVSLTGAKEGDQTVEIVNAAYDVSGDSVSGRPRGSRLLMRTTTRLKEILGDEGVEASVTMESWPLGTDPRQKPLYTLTVPGVGTRVVDGDVWMVDRSLGGDTSWWSAYRVGTGQHLFDTFVDLLRFTVSRADGTPRYVGLEVPPDDAADARLKEPHVLAVLTYASAEKVMREVLITCSDVTRARLLRSYADTMRTISLVERAAGVRVIRLVFEESYPSPPDAVVVTIPVVKDDLDVAHVEVPAGIRAAVWRR